AEVIYETETIAATPSGDSAALEAAFESAAPPTREPTWDDPALSPTLRRFYESNKRIDSRGTREALGWEPRFPSYREGLRDGGDAIEREGMRRAHVEIERTDLALIVLDARDPAAG
ncbi:hypothetical protein ABGA94_18795, partial [Stenotrophomonas sp. 3diitr2024]